MATTVAIPNLGDSVSEAVLTKWLKNDGDYVKGGEALAELETDKANVDLPSPTAGVFKRAVDAGGTVKVGQSVASIDEKASAPAGGGASAPSAAAATVVAPGETKAAPPSVAKAAAAANLNDLSPAPRRIAAEAGLDASGIPGTGPNGRVTKEDAAKAAAAPKAPVRTPPTVAATPVPAAKVEMPAPTASGDGVRREPMTKIRKKIAERLVSAQQTAAILTTFNEVDLTEVMALRAKHKDTFEKQYGVGLGFMSFFVKAACNALKAYPKVNAQIDGDDVVYNDNVHMGIAVSTERGLVVPVLRNADRLSFAQIESEIKRVAIAARDGKLGLSELSGGTFTITNGGVFGSLLSTPIINPPQSGILGMHTIQKRPMVVNDEVKIRSMMYVALSYDHRMVDGKDSVSFLVKMKQLLEDPSRLLLEV